jgi:hypothetical protein
MIFKLQMSFINNFLKSLISEKGFMDDIILAFNF